MRGKIQRNNKLGLNIFFSSTFLIINKRKFMLGNLLYDYGNLCQTVLNES